MSKTVLSFGAHPDDIEIGCGGTEALLHAQGYSITHVCMTSGEAGSATLAPEALAKIREQEARNAAELVGARVEFLRLLDGHVRSSLETNQRIISLIRRVRPSIVFVHSADDGMSDHVTVNAMVTSAIDAAAGPWHAGCGAPHRVPQVFGYEVWNPLRRPGWVVDIGSTLERKLAMVSCHASQLTPIDYRAACEGLARYRGIMTAGASAGEAFEVLRCVPALTLGLPS